MLTFGQFDFERDLDQVVQLIQQNLDPEVTTDFFRNKHLESPFGQSFGVVARLNEEVVGLRMGSYWEFMNHYLAKRVKSIRPVDTVVSRKYRKQGIFTKMNQVFVEISNEKDYDLIFNTPNENSLPANKKMGWKVLENRNHYKVGLILPFRRIAEFKEIDLSEIFWRPATTNDLYYHTNYKNNFFEWRYGGGKYRVASFNKENSNCVIYNTTRIRGLNTIVVYDLLGEETFYSTMINSLGNANSSYFIYYLNNANWKTVKFLFSLMRKKPNLLFKNDRYSIRENIKFSVGDLEAII